MNRISPVIFKVELYGPEIASSSILSNSTQYIKNIFAVLEKFFPGI